MTLKLPYKLILLSLLLIAVLFIQISSALPLTGCNSAAGTIKQSGYSITVSNVPCTSLSGISGRLNNASVISNVGGIWTINGKITVTNSTLYLNNSDVSEIHWDAKGNQYSLIAPVSSAIIKINNISITGWDSIKNTRKNNTNTGRISISKGSISDLSLDGMEQLIIYNPIDNIFNIRVNDSMDLWFENMNHQTIANIFITNGRATSSGSFYLLNSNHMTVYNISVKDTVPKTAMNFQYLNDSYVHHLSAVHIGTAHETNGGGIMFFGGRNITGHDYYIDFTGRSSFSPTGHLNNASFWNISINSSGHNGIDIHPASNIRVENISVTNSSSNNYYITSGYRDLGDPATNITITNAYSANAVGSAFVGDTDVYDVTLINFTAVNGGIQCGDCLNFSVINATLNHANGVTAWQKNTWNIYTFNGIPCENCYAIDMNFFGLAVEEGINAKTINTKWQDVIFGNHYRTNLYYTDILVVDANNNPITDATITLKNNVNAIIQSTDGYGNIKTKFTTDSTGHVKLPNKDRANSPAISQYDVNFSDKITYHTWTASVSAAGKTTNSIVISPDASWYRSNPDSPTYTITAIIPDATAGPHLTGFAPSESNPFPSGIAKKFVVWTDQNLTSMKWYLDGAQVASGSTSYTWTATTGTHNIRFEGSNANGNVIQQWNINGDSGINGGSGSQLIKSFFPVDPSPVQNNGSTYQFNVTTTQPMSTNKWLLDGTVVAAGSQKYNITWTKAGTHNLTYFGSNGNGSAGKTWIVPVADILLFDVDQNGIVDVADLKIIWNSINTRTYCKRCDINNNSKVEIYDWVLVSRNIG